jgi:hypothetical protein
MLHTQSTPLGKLKLAGPREQLNPAGPVRPLGHDHANTALCRSNRTVVSAKPEHAGALADTGRQREEKERATARALVCKQHPVLHAHKRSPGTVDGGGHDRVSPNTTAAPAGCRGRRREAQLVPCGDGGCSGGGGVACCVSARGHLYLPHAAMLVHKQEVPWAPFVRPAATS